MNHHDWVDYFETVNHRKPTQEELMQAYAKGELSLQTQPVYGTKSYLASPNPKKKRLSLWAVLGAILGVIVLSVSGYSIWRYQSGDITGTWELKATCDPSDRDWHKVNRGDYHYLSVSEDKEVQQFGYATSYTDVPAVDSFLGAQFKVNQWDKQMTPTLSESDYKFQLLSYFRDKFDSLGDAKAFAYHLADSYKEIPKTSISYEVNGASLIVTYRKANGKLLEKERYHRLSDSRAASVEEKAADIESDYFKNALGSDWDKDKDDEDLNDFSSKLD